MPVRLPLYMTGDFAEIRPNHFHSGIDIRTEGKEGLPVYAPADGYVSRINISAWGGGKVLYITHPDGYSTVYMHLSAFCGKIGQYVRDYQYSHHLFAFDTELPRDSIKVKKGDLVALTGNTGSSLGPHLHYEIRFAENDQTINPLYFGLPYSDPVAPTIAGIKIYPASPNTFINGRNQELKIFPTATPSTKKGKKGYQQPNNSSNQPTITVCGRFYTGIYTYDQMEHGSHNKNGVERIELLVDDTIFHTYSVPSFLFGETRAINAAIDYREYQRSREYYILSRRLRGDPTNFNSVKHDLGYLQFDDEKTHKLQYRVSDYKGNTTSRTFFVRAVNPSRLYSGSTTSSPTYTDNITVSGEPIAYFKPFHLVREGFSLIVNTNNIYENDHLIFKTTTDAGGITPQYHVSLRRNPLPPHDRINISLTIPDNLPQQLRSKLVCVYVNGKKASACPSIIEGNNVVATSRSWGGFALRLDTIAPTIAPLNFADGKTVKGSSLAVKVNDNLSGLDKYSCTVNGQWQLVEHDGKSSSLILDTKHLRSGKNTLVYTITDATGNTTTKLYTVYKN